MPYYPKYQKPASAGFLLAKFANANKYNMGKKIQNETDEEKRIRLLENHKRWLEKPGNKQKKYASDKNTQCERFKRWQENNRDKVRLKNANERAARLQRCPVWADKTAIKEFYLNCPTDYHVDHIIPLRGKTVSGLHVIENLQYLPAIENLKKGNSYSV